jgi:hypothetical protein
MKRLALLLPLLALAACRENDASIQIQDICVPPSGCSFSDKCDATVVVNPELDPAVATQMILFFQVENQLANNSQKDTYRLNTNDAYLEHYQVAYSGALSGTTPWLSATGVVPANGTAVTGLMVVPPTALATLTSAVAWPDIAPATAKVKLRGHYRDGTEFETAEYPVNIDIASGAPAIPSPCGGGPACPGDGIYPAVCP